MNSKRIVFMGTPPFAVASLRALLDAGIEVAAVVTAPDKPAGRGQQPRMSAVKEFALAHPVLKDRILQPVKLKDAAFLQQLNGTSASLYVVVAFRMLPATVWNRPSLGTINLHASLLPDYRGAAPINWAIMNGEKRTGVSTFFIQHDIDTGKVIHREEITIGAEESAGELHDKLMNAGAPLIVLTVEDIFSGTARAMPQEIVGDKELHHAPKLDPGNCRIDVNADVRRVHDHVRGLSPFPGSWAMLNGAAKQPMHFKVLRSRIVDQAISGLPGSISINQERMILQCTGGRIELLDVQPEGKRRMDASSFVRGLRDTSNLTLA